MEYVYIYGTSLEDEALVAICQLVSFEKLHADQLAFSETALNALVNCPNKYSQLGLPASWLRDDVMERLASRPEFAHLVLETGEVSEGALRSLQKLRKPSHLFVGKSVKFAKGALAELALAPKVNSLSLLYHGLSSSEIEEVLSARQLVELAFEGKSPLELERFATLPALRRIQFRKAAPHAESLRKLRQSRPELEVWIDRVQLPPLDRSSEAHEK